MIPGGIVATLLRAVSNTTAVADAVFAYVSLLLNGETSSGTNNNTFTDSSTNAIALTRGGTPTQGIFTPFSQTGWSGKFNGSSDYVQVAGDTIMNFGSSNWTCEAWVNLSAMPTSDAWPGSYSQLMVVVGTGTLNLGDGCDMLIGATKLMIQSNDTAYVSNAVHNMVTGVWYHLAYVRNGNTIYFYINGVLNGTVAFSGSVGTGANTWIGCETSQGAFFNGYISNVRVVNGTAVYTGNFTPSTSPLTNITNTKLLTLQNSRFLDNSSSPVSFTFGGAPSIQAVSPWEPTTAWSSSINGTSMYFNGTTDYLSSASGNANLKFAGNFTLEFWAYPTVANAYNEVFDTRIGGSSTTGLIFYINSSKQPALYTGGAALLTSSVAVALNSWNHIAYVRNGTTITIYVNGVSGGTVTNSTNFSDGNVSIGKTNESAANFYAGYISDLRVNNSTAIYTTTFTPPTAPLTASAGTSLLVTGNGAAVIDYAAKNDVITLGAVTTQTSTVKFGTNALRFPGTAADYISMPISNGLALGTGDFTVECWFNQTAKTATQPAIFSNYNSYTTGGLSLFAGHSSGSTTQFQVGSQGTTFPVIQSTTAITPGTWQHLCVMRTGTTLRLFVNGVPNGTATITATTAYNGVGTNFLVGNSGDNLANGFLNGYIDDFRVTKGVARYATGGFTPPSAGFYTH
jgi:hypothetical protein